MEPASNIRLLCKDCSAKPNPKYIKWDINDFVGKWVYKAFEENGRTEHLWIHVHSVGENKKTVLGTVDNDPVVLSIESGTEVVVYVNEIEKVFDGKEFL